MANIYSIKHAKAYVKCCAFYEFYSFIKPSIT